MKLNLIFDSTHDTLCFAAHELKDYLMQIDSQGMIYFNHTQTDCFRIFLSVDTTLDTTDKDCYTIRTSSQSLYLTGCNHRSVVLSVYKLLYLMGCRFLQPGKQYEVIPRLTLHDFFSTFLCDQCYSASFKHRGVCIEGANTIDNVLDFIDWLPKLGYNAFFIQFKLPYTFFERWYHHTLNPTLAKQPLSVERVQHFEQLMEEALKKRDLIYHKVGHGWTCETLGFEDLGWQKTSATLPPERKDWVALINGQRDFWDGIPTNTNLCYSNSEVQRAFIQNIIDYAQDHPSIDYLHIWLADEYNNLCECENCRNSLLSDQYIAILNALDEALTRLNLSTKIIFLIYQELLWPPLYNTFENHQRFTLMFAPISRTFEKSYCDCHIAQAIPPYTRNTITLPNSLEENLSFLAQWQKSWCGDSFVYDYPLGRAHYGDLGYINISKIISKDIKFLHKLNLNGYMSCQELRASFPHALPNYIMGLTLFDCSTDFEATAKDYFSHLYGAHSNRCYEYLQRLSSASSCDYFNGVGPRVAPLKAKGFLEATYLANCLLENTHPSESNYFLKKLYFHAQYVKLLASALYAQAANESDKAHAYYTDFVDFIRKNELNFQDSLDVYRVLEVSSKYTGFQLPNTN